MVAMLEVLTYIPFVVAVFLGFCIFVSLRKPSQFIKSDDLGIIERDLVDLVQVVVVAHTVEMPTSTLLEAVETNCLREVPVKYLFLLLPCPQYLVGSRHRQTLFYLQPRKPLF